jgi:iron only hydrogenase large subunit-like protein
MERSQILGVLSAMARGEELVAMIAPAVSAQFPGSVEQLMGAALKAGFTDVMEVALGAEVTTSKETAEFIERISHDPKTLMTTSCCPAYVNLIAKHLPQFIGHVSSTQSPMVYAAEMVHAERPHARTVFVGPCIAKRCEARRKGIDFVLSFEEFGAILAGRKIDIIACEPLERRRAADVSARNFARSCGVTEAVLKKATSEIPGFKLEAKQIDGIDRKTIGMLKLHDLGKLPGNFLEVMACPGGCVNGPCSLRK